MRSNYFKQNQSYRNSSAVPHRRQQNGGASVELAVFSAYIGLIAVVGRPSLGGAQLKQCFKIAQMTHPHGEYNSPRPTPFGGGGRYDHDTGLWCGTSRLEAF